MDGSNKSAIFQKLWSPDASLNSDFDIDNDINDITGNIRGGAVATQNGVSTTQNDSIIFSENRYTAEKNELLDNKNNISVITDNMSFPDINLEPLK